MELDGGVALVDGCLQPLLVRTLTPHVESDPSELDPPDPVHGLDRMGDLLALVQAGEHDAVMARTLESRRLLGHEPTVRDDVTVVAGTQERVHFLELLMGQEH